MYKQSRKYMRALLLSLPRIATVLLLASIAVATPSVAKADPPTTKPASDSKNLWSLSFGYLADQKRGGNSHGYYLLKYNDETVTTHGDAISVASPATMDSAFTKAPDDSTPHLSLNNGLVSGSGGVLDGIFRHSLSIKPLQAFLGTFSVNTTTDLKNLTYNGGLESPRLPVLDWVNNIARGRANTWTYVGIVNETLVQQNGTTRNQDNGLLTYRTFLGAPLSFVKVTPDNQIGADYLKAYDDALAKQILDRGLSDAKTLQAWYKDTKAARRAIPAITDEKLREVLNAILDIGDRSPGNIMPSLADVREQMKKRFDQTFAAKTVAVPVATVWAESKGWYRFSNQSNPIGARFTNMLTVNAQYFLNPKTGSSNWIKVSYEVGTDRAAPNVYNNFLAVTTGFSF